ncbi:MAG: hypothetical protein BWX71_01201 [Deltaproteobacteria bacterium ADurb.Bin072]|nr:MAG: hypothetical protein BWX71_01201 [Deltaproteobacteria bacterium ADurb.Bin072]
MSHSMRESTDNESRSQQSRSMNRQTASAGTYWSRIWLSMPQDSLMTMYASWGGSCSRICLV